MAEMAGPFEILEMGDEETKDFKVLKWEVGETKIHPAYKPEGKWIKSLRLFIPEDTKDYFPFYWDVTSQTLIAQLVPMLEVMDLTSKVFRVTKHGLGPRARFSVEVI